MNLLTKQKQTQTQKTNLRLPKGKRDKSGVWDQQIQTTIYKTDKQQDPTVQHREHIQYLVINYNGKEYEKQYIYVKLNHFAVYQKLTKHCKLTILQ